MNGYAATVLVILATFFTTTALSRADETSTVEIDHSAIQLEESSVATVSSGNESTIAAASEAATSAPLESKLSSEFSTNETDISGAVMSSDIKTRFQKIIDRAARDTTFQRRPVEVLECCFAEETCDCFDHFVKSVETWGAASNETTSLMMCSALYALLPCPDENYTDECTAFCRCINSDPWVDAVGGVMSALFFVCLLLTLVVYACVPRLRNLHGKCLISYLVAFIAAESVATVSSALVCGYTPNAVSATVNYLTMVRYFWINILSFDVYWTCKPFQSVRQQPRTGCFSRERRKFVYFSAAAWGGGALVFGLVKSFGRQDTPIICIAIVFFLLAASCVPLILTLVRIWRSKRQTRKSCINISKMKLNWFYLTSKLLCLSGAGKLMSVVAYVTLRGTPAYNWLFVVLRLEGPIMLFLFVLNVRVRGLVRQRLTTLEWISADKINDNCSNDK